jgi:hypothetical protein
LFNLYFSKQCGTHYLTLATTISPSISVGHSILYVLRKIEAFFIHTLVRLALACRCLCSTTLAVWPSLLENFRYKESVEPSALIPLLGHDGAAKRIIHIGFKNNDTSELDTTLLPKTLRRNFKALGLLWVISYIRCSISTFLNNARLNSPHTHHNKNMYVAFGYWPRR